MIELVGAEHRQLVEHIVQRVRDLAQDQPPACRVIALEGPSGIGKSRVVREVYRELRHEFDREGYWPDLPEATPPTDHASCRIDSQLAADPLPDRKVIGPDPVSFVWPAHSLPGFGWWQFNCERMQSTGAAIDVLAQSRPEIEAHLTALALAWANAASPTEKLRHARNDLIDLVKDATYEGGLDAGTKAIEKAFDVVLPGVGFAVSSLLKGYKKVKGRQQRAEALATDVEFGADIEEQRSSASRELASLILGVAHSMVPSVVVIEDAHQMSNTLAECLDLLTKRRSPIVIITMAWPEGRVAPTYASWIEGAIGDDRAERVEMPKLTDADLAQFVIARAPSTDFQLACAAARHFGNPLALEVTLSAESIVGAIWENGGSLPEELLLTLPTGLEEVYRRRLRELQPNAALALSVAAAASPYPRATQLYPFCRRVVATAAEQFSQRTPKMPKWRLAALHAGFEKAEASGAWIDSTSHSDVFREALLASTAFESFVEFVKLPSQVRTFRTVVASTLIDAIDTLRDTKIKLHHSERSLVLSRWLLDLDPAGSAEVAVLAAAHCVATELAATHHYREATELLSPRLADLSLGVDQDDGFSVYADHAEWLGRAGRVQQAVEAFNELLGNDRLLAKATAREVLVARNKLARWQGQAGDHTTAIQTLQALLADMQITLGPSDRATFAVRSQFARWRGQAGDVGGAIAAFEELVSDERSALDADDSELLAARNNLGHWLDDGGEFQRARDELLSVLADRARVLGPDHPDTLITRNRLARVWGELGELEKARDGFKTLLEDRTRILGPDHPDTLVTRHNLVRWLGECGDREDAREEALRLVEDRIRVLGADHPRTFTARYAAARWVGELGQQERAEQEMRDLLVEQERVLGMDNPDVLITRHGIARWQEDTNPKHALADYESVLQDRIRILGPDHPRTKLTRDRMEALRGRMPGQEE